MNLIIVYFRNNCCFTGSWWFLTVNATKYATLDQSLTRKWALKINAKTRFEKHLCAVET